MSDKSQELPERELLNTQITGGDDQPSLPLQENEQIIEREHIEKTPFTLITRDGKSFLAFGKYKVSSEYHSKEEAMGALTNDFWEIQLNVITLIITLEKDKE